LFTGRSFLFSFSKSSRYGKRGKQNRKRNKNEESAGFYIGPTISFFSKPRLLRAEYTSKNKRKEKSNEDFLFILNGKSPLSS
jgi:hypothetical protein